MYRSYLLKYRRRPGSTPSYSSAASYVYKRQAESHTRPAVQEVEEGGQEEEKRAKKTRRTAVVGGGDAKESSSSCCCCSNKAS